MVVKCELQSRRFVIFEKVIQQIQMEAREPLGIVFILKLHGGISFPSMYNMYEYNVLLQSES